MRRHAPPASTVERVLPYPPEDLTSGKLHRLGEGIGKVVYASEHWVVKRERSPSEILTLIVVWRILRRIARFFPAGIVDQLLQRPSKRVRFLRVLLLPLIIVVPRSIWFMTHIGHTWNIYRWRNIRGEKLAKTHLRGTSLIPEQVSFPPTRVKVGGWPGWLTVSTATERVEATLSERITELATAGRFEEVEKWLNRFLDLRQSGWQRGLFSVDAHLKNFGITEDRIVLLDPGGLTDSWTEIDKRLSFEENVEEPHIQLGLGPLLESRPDIAERFDVRWKATVNRDHVRLQWPTDQAK